MRVLVVAEGAHEIGAANEEELNASPALYRLIERTVEAQLTFHSLPWSKIRTHHGKGPGYFKKAVGALREAERRRCDALVMLVDEDGNRDRLLQFNRAQDDHSMSTLPRALGLAIRSFDAWILADEKTLSSVLQTTVQTQRSPEDAKNPKEECEQLLRNADSPLSPREVYAEVLLRCDLEIVERRCPKGFAPFVKRLRELRIDGHS